MKKIYLYPNGNLSAWDEDHTIDDINGMSWIRVYLEHLEDRGFDPTEFVFLSPKPDVYFVPFKTTTGDWNWFVEYGEEKAKERREKLTNEKTEP